MIRGYYTHANFSDVNCEVHPRFPDKEITDTLRFGGVVTLNELFDGIEITATTPHGEPKLTLTASWAG